MSLYNILITQGSFPMHLSPQQVVSELMVVWDNGGKVNEVLFAVGAAHTNGHEKVTTNEYYYQWC